MIFERDGHRHRRKGCLKITIEGGDALYARLQARRQHDHLISRPDRARDDPARISAETIVRPHHALDGHAETRIGLMGIDHDAFEVFEQARTAEPRQIAAALYNVVTGERTKRQEVRAAHADALKKR